jgi:ferredoxin-NADP reductase/Na+-translocating ferredoxin:NAD+ oxidoreductase RnfD subunit
MIKSIDKFLDKITMYRLVLYVLIFLLLIALAFSSFKILPFSPQSLLFETAVIIVYSLFSNRLFAWIFKVPANSESVYITALILILLIIPPKNGEFLSSLPFLIWVSVLSMAGKFIFNLKGKHIFNPAALAVAMTAFTINQTASWWIGTSSMFGFVLIGGLLITRKVRKFDLVITFVLVSLLTMALLGLGNPYQSLQRAILFSPLVFFATIMLTEPLTMPPTRDGRIAYAILTGWFFAPQTHIGQFYFTPELALLLGNLFTYSISPKYRLSLKLIEKKISGSGILDFVFESKNKLNFLPGQYMEWTLGLNREDFRGNRRYFTLASSPTEKNPLLGVKFYPDSSRFKTELMELNVGEEIFAGQLAGEFVLPKNTEQKLVFVAGGIGITPFRSMVKYLIDKNEKRDIIVLYSNRKFEEIVYWEILEEARKKLNIKTVCTLTDANSLPVTWDYETGYFNSSTILNEIPDYKERLFYISGSHSMVTSFKEMLLEMKIKRKSIKTDFFPGLV